MAELRIQRKKPGPSPWLLVLLALALLGVGAWLFLRSDPPDEPAPPANAAQTPAPPPPADTAAAKAAPEAAPEAVPEEIPTAPAGLDEAAAADPAAPGYARRALEALTTSLVQLTDRADLADDATVREARDNLTSATDRLRSGDPQASLRPGLVAAADLLRVVQQKTSPDLEPAANALQRQAAELSGRTATPADRQATQQFFAQAAELLRTLLASGPAVG